MITAQHLIAVRQRLDAGWCQRDMATTADGVSCEWKDPAATNYCLMGAIFSLYGDVDNALANAIDDFTDRLFCKIHPGGTYAAYWQDQPGRTKEEVLAFVDQCIRYLQDYELLVEARALVAAGWCQEFGARDKDGEAADTLGPAAICFCMQGAIYRCTDGGKSRPMPSADILGFPNWQVAFRWNDAPERTQAEVVARYDATIKDMKSIICP